MDHTYIEEHQVADRYLQGKLADDELAQFEEHYLSCPECLDRLETIEALERGLKRAAALDAARASAARQLAVVAWLARLGRSRQAALLLSGLLLVLLAPGLALYRTGELGRELGKARSALTTAAREHDELAREREERAQFKRELDEARAPQANVSILYLGTERGTSGGEPTFQFRLPATPGPLILSLPLDPPRQPAYRVVLSRADGREIWQSSDVQTDHDNLAVSVPSSLLAPGDHLLALLGVAPGGRATPVARFPFRVLPAS
jgi:hypothetical protein